MRRTDWIEICASALDSAALYDGVDQMELEPATTRFALFD